MHIVLAGHPMGDQATYGPFATREEASAWAEQQPELERIEWEVMPLHSPDSGVDLKTQGDLT